MFRVGFAVGARRVDSITVMMCWRKFSCLLLVVNVRPFINIPTGEYLQEQLEALGWTHEDFAQLLGMSLKGVAEILNSKTALTVETAQRVGRALGTSERLWLNIDAQYRSRLRAFA